jgi:hypothetical protein
MKPTSRQLAYLRALAERTGTTFTPPTTSRQATSEINRLRALPRSSASERILERRQVQHDLAERPDDATAIRARDLRGYGSDARWTHRPVDTEARS